MKKTAAVYTSLLFLLCLVLIFISLPLLLNFYWTPPQTYLLGLDYSRLTRDQVVSRLKADFSSSPSIKIVHQQQMYDLPLSSISARLDQEKITSSLFYDFLSHGFLDYLFYPYRRHFHSLSFIVDESSLDAFIDNLSVSIAKPYIPASLELVDNSRQARTIVVKNGEIGYRVDKSQLKQDVYSSLTNWRFDQPISLPLLSVGFLPSSDQIIQTRAKAEHLINASISLVGGVYPILIEDKTIISWLNFDGSYNYDLIQSYLSSLSQSLDAPPRDALFKFEQGKVLEFQPSVDGQSVQTDVLLQRLIAAIDKVVQVPSQSQVEIPFTPVKAKITTESANNLGIRELLGRGVSTFKHSNATRNHNIQKGASAVNRILVAPGETFSFLHHLGDVTVESGYKKAYIIRQGKTELDVGGGICQVSTTLFRAILNSGLNITQRQNHAYRVSYYEEDMPPGYDATVFIPTPDLKFINDTGYHLLIQSLYDGVNKKLTYEIYGTSDDRRVEITNYRKWGAAPAPPARYIDDPTLPPGKVIQDEQAIPGLKTAFDWTVTRNGEILHQKTFQSNYVPWAAVYRRGPSL